MPESVTINNCFIQNLILRFCKQPRSFEFISKNLSGYDPIETLSLLKKMEEEGKLICINDLWSIKEVDINDNALQLYPTESKLYLQKHMGYFDFLKTPHPLDFEWRNSSLSLNKLLNKINSLVNPTDKLLFLGMPTLFATAILKDIPNTISLIERNAPIIQGVKKINTDISRFRTIEEDIFTINPGILTEHYCIAMDPPWYTPHFFQFMWLASKCVSIGGLVIISLPPLNTRPNIIEERLEWFEFCRSLGLCIETLEPQQLQYAMPFFEFNAFRAAGIKNILPFWRKGDLAIFRKIEEVSITRPKHIPTQQNWIEREYNTSRIRINISEIDEINNDLEVLSLIKGDILPTVSSRDERRKNANVWTSGNRIFSTNRPNELIKTIDLITKGLELNDNQKVLKDFLDTITEFEEREFKDYLDWIYYEMERQTS